MNRREFAYVSALAGALSNAAGAKGATTQPARIPEAAGLITEMVFLDDCVRLAMYDPALSAASKSALAEHSDFVRNGALSPSNAAAKSALEYALAAGRVFSAALQRHRNPNSAEARVYQDVAVLRDLREHSGQHANGMPAGDLLELLHVRRRLAFHTLIPDDATVEDVHVWLEGICGWWNDQRNLRRPM
jgi:hypothetical protein